MSKTKTQEQNEKQILLLIELVDRKVEAFSCVRPEWCELDEFRTDSSFQTIEHSGLDRAHTSLLQSPELLF